MEENPADSFQTHESRSVISDDDADDDDADTGVMVLVSGLNVQLASVYWLPCPAVCPRPAEIQPLRDVDTSYVVSSLLLDGTGHHVVRQVLIVAAHNGTSLQLSPADRPSSNSSQSRRRLVRLDEFETFAVSSAESEDLGGLDIDASRPVFVAVSLQSPPNLLAASTAFVPAAQYDSGSLSQSVSSPDSDHVSSSDDPPSAEARPTDSQSLNQYQRSAPRVGGAVSASRDAAIVSGRSEADVTNMSAAAVALQLDSIGRLGLTYVLMSTAGSRQAYRVIGT